MGTTKNEPKNTLIPLTSRFPPEGHSHGYHSCQVGYRSRPTPGLLERESRERKRGGAGEREREGGCCVHILWERPQKKALRRERRRTSNHFARTGGLLGGTRAEQSTDRKEGRRSFTVMAMSALHRLARSQLQHSRHSAALLTTSSRSASNVSALLRDLLWWGGVEWSGTSFFLLDLFWMHFV